MKLLNYLFIIKFIAQSKKFNYVEYRHTIVTPKRFAESPKITAATAKSYKKSFANE